MARCSTCIYLNARCYECRAKHKLVDAVFEIMSSEAMREIMLANLSGPPRKWHTLKLKEES